MSDGLIINPYAQILVKDQHTAQHFKDETDADFILIAPVPGKGLQNTGISAAARPNLHELFLELSQTQFDFLDVKHDLDEAQRDFLSAGGILVEAGKAPQKPFFQCLLNEVEAPDFQASTENLLVNPTFRFEPFSFENLRSWINERHFSPYLPSAWTARRASKIEFGYWLENARAEIVSQFRAGQKPPAQIDSGMLAKLIEAEILIAPENLRKQCEFSISFQVDYLPEPENLVSP
jgi:hypothetical protein